MNEQYPTESNVSQPADAFAHGLDSLAQSTRPAEAFSSTEHLADFSSMSTPEPAQYLPNDSQDLAHREHPPLAQPLTSTTLTGLGSFASDSWDEVGDASSRTLSTEISTPASPLPLQSFAAPETINAAQRLSAPFSLPSLPSVSFPSGLPSPELGPSVMSSQPVENYDQQTGLGAPAFPSLPAFATIPAFSASPTFPTEFSEPTGFPEPTVMELLASGFVPDTPGAEPGPVTNLGESGLGISLEESAASMGRAPRRSTVFAGFLPNRLAFLAPELAVSATDSATDAPGAAPRTSNSVGAAFLRPKRLVFAGSSACLTTRASGRGNGFEEKSIWPGNESPGEAFMALVSAAGA